MPDLVQKTLDALTAFNGAQGTHNYSGIALYLAPQVTIYRVDDPGSYIQGTPAQIVQVLNARQNGKWPQLQNCRNFALNPRSRDVVLGTADYCDTYGTAAIPVRCSYHFDANGLIDVAYVIPL